jgi:hypothetical protein
VREPREGRGGRRRASGVERILCVTDSPPALYVASLGALPARAPVVQRGWPVVVHGGGGGGPRLVLMVVMLGIEEDLWVEENKD